jgi:hypothetical protein
MDDRRKVYWTVAALAGVGVVLYLIGKSNTAQSGTGVVGAVKKALTGATPTTGTVKKTTSTSGVVSQNPRGSILGTTASTPTNSENSLIANLANTFTNSIARLTNLLGSQKPQSSSGMSGGGGGGGGQQSNKQSPVSSQMQSALTSSELASELASAFPSNPASATASTLTSEGEAIFGSAITQSENLNSQIASYVLGGSDAAASVGQPASSAASVTSIALGDSDFSSGGDDFSS